MGTTIDFQEPNRQDDEVFFILLIVFIMGVVGLVSNLDVWGKWL